MLILATTRFNNDTWVQNCAYKKREKIGIDGCIYGSPLRMKSHIPVKSDVMVLEMNNSNNKIVGIGWIKNYVHADKYYKIYLEGNYNRYVYRGRVRIDAEGFDEDDALLIKTLEHLLFYGARHSKRAQGICEIPDWIKNNKQRFNFVEAVKMMFEKRSLIKKLI